MTTAAVVGSGPNGLAAAIRLATAGLEVTVVEAADRPGGGTLTSERTLPGLLHDDCAAFHPTGVASPFFRSLDLERHGLRWLWPEVDLAHPLDDGRAGLAARDLAETARSLGVDAERWRRLFAPSLRHFEPLIDEVLQPVAHLPRHPVTLGRFGTRAVLPATVLARLFRDEPAKGLFTGVAAHSFGRLDTPFSGSVGLMLAASAHAVGWPVAEGGTEAITRALLAELAAHGGRVVTGQHVTSTDHVADLLGGAPAITMLDTNPRDAARILGPALPTRIRRAYQRFRYGPAAFKVDIALEGDIPWTNPDVRRAGTVHLGGSAAEIVQTEAETTAGRMPQRPFVLLGQQYLVDPSRSTPEANPVYAYAHVPHAYTGDATEAILDQVERFAPGFREQVLQVTSRGPMELAAHNPNYVGGDISAGANTARQLLARPRLAVDPYATGVPGTYLCSSATPPGAGVHGMGGYLAAGAALRHLR
ncbi:phytoene desaturase family protein [Nocardioides jiangxiensis]|uniref:NAD(P)/FAD-dependent oxidoreductase n=1 Tax=Nocardioides jiangxiensis TaxID=3064524 RepID=A0ABT9B3V8_9ACTN|nr:NAD(P)/FAD-dependent oxidoreductase [Nocardioides sp. WY-20]MDO7869532.1 NAD(P)/FAD-dependent oxidoreductase [Nocardioides sp. WY-20]